MNTWTTGANNSTRLGVLALGLISYQLFSVKNKHGLPMFSVFFSDFYYVENTYVLCQPHATEYIEPKVTWKEHTTQIFLQWPLQSRWHD